MQSRMLSLFTMKAIVFVLIFIYLVNITAGLHCYECDDNLTYSDEVCKTTNKTTHCLYPDTEFCLTIVRPYSKKLVNCVNEESCVEKSCNMFESFCKSVGTREIYYSSDDEPSVLTCCKGDLCNKDTILPSSQNKLSIQSSLFYALVSSFLSLLSVLS